MKTLMVSLLAYSTAATGALFGLWLVAKWPNPRWSHLLVSWGVIAATVAVEMIGPIPGTVMRRLAPSSCSDNVLISFDTVAMRASR